MTEKVKVTTEQAKAIEYLKREGYPTRQIVKNALNENWCNEPEEHDVNIELLNGMDPEALVFAVHGMYEVEPQFRVGDWVAYDSASKGLIVCKVEQVNEMSVDTDYIGSNGVKQNFDKEGIRHATPEEIKTEQERQAWAKIGRKVGEFKENDSAKHRNGEIILSVPWMKTCYDAEVLKGFYPAESFVSFGGEVDA